MYKGKVRKGTSSDSSDKPTLTDDSYDSYVNQEGILQQLLFTNYSKDVKPTRYADEQMNVTISFKLSKIGGLVIIILH